MKTFNHINPKPTNVYILRLFISGTDQTPGETDYEEENRRG